MKKILSLLICCIFLFSSCAVQQDLSNKTVIELNNHRGLMFIDVTVNGKPARLLIDTGASKSLIDITQNEKYEFSYLDFPQQRYIGLGGLKDVYVVFDYKIEPMFVSFLGADLTELMGYFNDDEIFILGILGSNFFDQHNAVIDYRRNLLIY